MKINKLPSRQNSFQIISSTSDTFFAASDIYLQNFCHNRDKKDGAKQPLLKKNKAHNAVWVLGMEQNRMVQKARGHAAFQCVADAGGDDDNEYEKNEHADDDGHGDNAAGGDDDDKGDGD